MGGFDETVKKLLLGLDVMSKDEVRDMVDQLTQRVVNLEEGQAATTHFHVVKPDDVNDSYSSISVDMGPHTAPRAPLPIQITPEKDDEGIDPLFAADIKQQLSEGDKKLEELWASPLKIPPNEGKKEKAKIDPFNPSPTRKLKEKIATSDNPYPELNSNLEFI